MTLFITTSFFHTSVFFWPLKNRYFCLIWFLEAFWYISPAWNLILFTITSHYTLWICFCFLLWLFVVNSLVFNLFLCLWSTILWTSALFVGWQLTWTCCHQHKQQEVRTLSDIFCWKCGCFEWQFKHWKLSI